MKIYILADMEGISGIRLADQVRSDKPDYAEGRQLMMAEINAAVDAAYASGATEVIVCDTHGGGGQLRLAEMDPRPTYEMPAGARRLMPSLDESFQGVCLLGHHARAGTLNGFLDHTMDSQSWFEYSLNGQVMGEVGIEAAWAGHFGVPVVMVSGDAATADEAHELLGRVECAVVKRGLGRSKAHCLPLPAAHAQVRNAIARALQNIGQYRPFQPTLPATVQLIYQRTDIADSVASYRPCERVDARTCRQKIDSLLDVCCL